MSAAAEEERTDRFLHPQQESLQQQQQPSKQAGPLLRCTALNLQRDHGVRVYSPSLTRFGTLGRLPFSPEGRRRGEKSVREPRQTKKEDRHHGDARWSRRRGEGEKPDICTTCRGVQEWAGWGAKRESSLRREASEGACQRAAPFGRSYPLGFCCALSCAVNPPPRGVWGSRWLDLESSRCPGRPHAPCSAPGRGARRGDGGADLSERGDARTRHGGRRAVAHVFSDGCSMGSSSAQCAGQAEMCQRGAQTAPPLHSSHRGTQPVADWRNKLACPLDPLQP